MDETTVTIDDIYPVGMSARVESIGDDDSIQIRTLERVSLDDIELDENGRITATASIRPEVDDLPLEEEKQIFTNLRNSLLKFVQNYQWGSGQEATLSRERISMTSVLLFQII